MMRILRDCEPPEAEQPSQRFEVEVDQNNSSLKLTQQSWAEGMGWFTQKTMTICPEDAPALIQQLQQALIATKLNRSTIQPRLSSPKPASDKGKILEFPGKRAMPQNEDIAG